MKNKPSARNELVGTCFGWMGSLYRKLFKHTVAANQEPPRVYTTVLPQEENKLLAKETFKDVSPSLYLTAIINESVYSKVENIPTWKRASQNLKVYPLPNKLDAPFECTESNGCSRVSQTVWVLYSDGDNCQLVVPNASQGRLSLDGKIVQVNNPADDMPEGVYHAIQVILGTELVEGELRGCRWTHFLKGM